MFDIIITGSSRPDLLKITVESFRKFLHTEKNLNWILHEDCINIENSKESIKWAEKNGFSAVIIDLKPIGLGLSIDKLISKVKTPYALYIQDDWELERPVELDRILWVMDDVKNINHVLFGKMKLRQKTGDFLHENEVFQGLDLTLNNSWHLNPAIWRMSKVREKWNISKPDRIEGFFTNQFGTHKQRLDKTYCFDKLGSFFLGKIGEYRYVRHLGSTCRMEDFRIKDSTLTFEIFDYKNKAPWLSYKKRPIDKSVGVKFSKTNKEQFYRELENIPNDIKEYILGKNFEIKKDIII